MKDIAYITTQSSGELIASHIQEAGYNVVLKSTSDKSAQVSVAQAAQNADVIFTYLSSQDEVEDVYLATDGVLKASKKGAFLIDLSTASPQLAREISEVAEAQDKHAFDCPIMGTLNDIENKTAVCACGAQQKDVQQVLDIIKTFTAQQYFFGRAGAGQAAKLCNQLSSAGAMLGMADALALAEQSQLDQDAVLSMMGDMQKNQAHQINLLAKKAIDGDWKALSTAQDMCNDLHVAIEHSEELDITLPGAETAHTLYDMLVQIGGADLGVQALALLYQDEAAAVAAGLDWSRLDMEAFEEDTHEHECSCGHDHEHTHDHECHCHHDHE